MQKMAEVMADYDMYVTSSGDVGLTNQTGHPAAIVQTGFGAPPTNTGGRGRGDATGAAPAATPTPPPVATREQPLVTTIIGQLFNDDKILSVAHAYQQATDWHKRHPKL
jgi:Asp-tRNA(Asn)/Glu-tRNA(Gln) amidotransferase A subunit family amidase